MSDQLSNDVAQAKNNRDQGRNNFQTWFKNGFAIGLLVIGVIVGYTRLEAKVDYDTKRLDKMEEILEGVVLALADAKTADKLQNSQYQTLKDDLTEIKGLLRRRIP